jgi:hypothetical protein
MAGASTGAGCGNAAVKPTGCCGTTTMKMMISTRSTSISGVKLISAFLQASDIPTQTWTLAKSGKFLPNIFIEIFVNHRVAAGRPAAKENRGYPLKGAADSA